MQKEKTGLKNVATFRKNMKRRIVLIKRDFMHMNENHRSDVVKLRHPRSGTDAMFVFSSDNSTVYEIFTFSQKRSWFINDYVLQNGNIYFFTPVDPLFLILQYLKKFMEEGKVVPLEDLVIDDDYPETHRLLKTSALKSMHLLADRKGPEDLNAWKYNEEKIMKWLSKKIENVTHVLKQKNINVSGSATSKRLIKFSNDNPEDTELYVKYAYDLISEYISEDLSLKLAFTLGLPEITQNELSSSKRKLGETNTESENKKIKVDEKIVNPSKPLKPQGLSSKEKPKAKAASGTMLITSFFKKK